MFSVPDESVSSLGGWRPDLQAPVISFEQALQRFTSVKQQAENLQKC